MARQTASRARKANGRTPGRKERQRSIDFRLIADAPILRPSEEHSAVAEVQLFLARFGYLDIGAVQTSILDDATSAAVAAYQRFHGMAETGEIDRRTRELMLIPRCGMADLPGPSAIAFTVSKALDRLDLTFAFGKGTTDFPELVEFDVARKAFASWAATGHFAFHEVGQDHDPDIFLTILQPGDADYKFPDRQILGWVLDNGPGKFRIELNDDRRNWGWENNLGYAQDLEETVVHEIGHVLGLGHSKAADSVMHEYSHMYLEFKVLSADDLAALEHLYGTPPKDLTSAPIFNSRQHIGNEPGILPGTWAGRKHAYAFDTPRIDVTQPAWVMLQARHVDNEHNVFSINEVPIAGGLPVTTGNDGWAAQVLHVMPGTLRPGGNLLRIEGRTDDGSAHGDIDDFVVDNAFVLYSVIKPGLFLRPAPPRRWLGLTDPIHEPMDSGPSVRDT